MRSCIGN
jgi:hypothetical protein